MNANKTNKFVGYLLVVLQAFIGFTAIAGGFRLVTNPNGIPDFPLEWLNNSPFSNYFIPGLVLLIVIGFGNVMAGTVSFLRKRYSGSVAALFGIFLVFYMTIEIWFVGLRNVLQPLYLILGIIVFILGLKAFKSVVTAHQIEVESIPNKLPS